MSLLPLTNHCGIREDHSDSGTPPISEQMLQQAARAAAMVQALFEVFLEKTWAVHLRKVDMIRDKNLNDSTCSQILAYLASSSHDIKHPGAGWLCPFLLDQEQTMIPWEYRSAVLADGNSLWALAMAYAAVHVLFDGKLSHMYELELTKS